MSIQVLLRKAQQTHTIMQQNLTWALLCKWATPCLKAASIINYYKCVMGSFMSLELVKFNVTHVKFET